MSYSQLLSQYADKMNSARAHTEDYAKQNQDMKAQTLQEKFNSIAEPLTQGAEGLRYTKRLRTPVLPLLRRVREMNHQPTQVQKADLPKVVEANLLDQLTHQFHKEQI